MIRRHFFLFCIFFCQACLAYESPTMLNFYQLLNLSEEQAFELAHVDQQQVRIRGFLYKADDGRLILAAEPNLKSCCVASTTTINRQIIVSTDADLSPKQNVAVLMEGKFIVEKGRESSRYRLENAVVVVEDRSLNGLFGMGALLIVGGIITVAKARKRKKAASARM